MKQYEAYLFDWDGTLCQTLQVWLEVLRKHYNKFELYPSDAKIAALFGDWRAAEKLGLDPVQTDQFIKELEIISHAAIRKAPLYPEAKSTLLSLRKRDVKLALITSSIRKTIDDALGHHDILDLFDIVVTGNDVAQHKPHPESLLFATQELNVAPRDCVMIGDSDKDLLAATNAKMDSILFFPESHKLFHNEGYLKGLKPSNVITKLSSIIE